MLPFHKTSDTDKLLLFCYSCYKVVFHRLVLSVPSESEHVECRPPGQTMEVPDHNGIGYVRGPQGEAYRSRGQLQRHHTIQTCDDAYVSEMTLLRTCTTSVSSLAQDPSKALEKSQIDQIDYHLQVSQCYQRFQVCLMQVTLSPFCQ